MPGRRMAVCGATGMRLGKASWSAAVTGLRLEKEAEYRSLHAAVWPGVIENIGRCMVSRFDIFLIDLHDQLYLFYWLKYDGDDFESDMKRMGESAVNQRWWQHTDPCQLPTPKAAAKDEIWLTMTAL